MWDFENQRRICKDHPGMLHTPTGKVIHHFGRDFAVGEVVKTWSCENHSCKSSTRDPVTGLVSFPEKHYVFLYSEGEVLRAMQTDDMGTHAVYLYLKETCLKFFGRSVDGRNLISHRCSNACALVGVLGTICLPKEFENARVVYH
jgi:hypothetical protein